MRAIRATRQHPRVAIIGGGISGLAAAFKLRELAAVGEPAFEVALFERSISLGHALGTVREDGFVMETGADSFLSDKPWALDLAKRLGLEQELIGTRERFRKTHVVRDGHLVEIPDGFTLLAPTRFLPVFRSPLFSLRGKLRMALEPLIPPRRGGGDESLASFVSRRVGREVLERVAQPLMAGIHTADPQSLSLEATMPRFLEMERRHGSLFRGLRAIPQPAGSNGTSGARWGLFVSFRHGMRTLVDALAARLEGCVRLGADVIALARIDSGKRWRLVLADNSVFEAEAVLLATPAFGAARLLEGCAPDLAHLLADIRYSSVATVNLAYRTSDCPHLPESFGFVAPAIERRKIIAATFSSTKFDGRAPEGAVLMRAFLGGALHEQMMELNEGAMVAAVREEFSALLGLNADPILARVRRWPNAMPQYSVGHIERVARIERELLELPNLTLAGAAYRGVGVPDCVHSAERAAQAVFKRLAEARVCSSS